MNKKVEKKDFMGRVLMFSCDSQIIPIVQAYQINEHGFYEQVEVEVTFKEGQIIIESLPFDGEIVVR